MIYETDRDRLPDWWLSFLFYPGVKKNSTLNEVELHKRKVRIVKKYDTVSERSKNGTYSCRS